MTTSIKPIITAGTSDASVSVNQSNTQSAGSFERRLIIEKADALMRQTDQHSQWQEVSQKSDAEVFAVAELLLQRETMVQLFTQGKDVDRQQFDTITTKLSQAGLSFPSSQYFTDSASSSSPLPPEQTPSINKSSSLLQEENLLILDTVFPILGSSDIIFGYGDGQTNQLPLQSVSDLLDFKIQVDPEHGTATGWFINQNRTLSIDARSQTIEANGTVYPWDDNLISLGEDDIYIDSSLMSKIFPIDFTISTGAMTVQIEPREKLPIELLLTREQKRLRLLNQPDNSLKYEAQEIPYAPYSFPVLDVSLGSKIGNPTGAAAFLGNYSILAAGDLAYMGATIFLSGVDEDPLTTARVTLSRKDIDKDLLGPMKASGIYLGDVYPANFSVLRRPSQERGVAISNYDLLRSRDFDTTHFQGNVQPGWDVELYRNGKLIDSTRVLADGEYLFEDVEVFFGKNNFKVIAFGPQGQEKILEEEVVQVGGGMLPAGELEYNLSATQREENIIALERENFEDSSKGAGRFNTTMSYGLTDAISLAGGLSSVEFENTRHNYLMAGLRGSYSDFYGQADYLFDTESGSGLALQGQTALGPVNLKARYERYDNFIEENAPNDPLSTKAYLGINGRTPEFEYFPSLSYTLSADHSIYDDNDRGQANFNISTNIDPFALSNELIWTYRDFSGEASRNVFGKFRASGSLGDISLTGLVNYTAGDDSSFNRYSLSANKGFTNKLFGSTTLTYVPGENERFSANFGLSWDAGYFYLSPSASIDSEGNYGANLRLTFSLGQNPITKDIEMESKSRTRSGGTTALVYHDANNNQIFDEEDTPLPDVTVRAKQATAWGDTNEEGVARLNRMQVFQPTDVEIEIDSLEDPFWQPSTPGVAMVPRAGVVGNLEFPVVTTGEIDGTIYGLKPDGSEKSLSGVFIEILDEQGKVVQSVNSEYDGFFLFEKVFPGTYTLVVNPGESLGTIDSNQLQQEIVIGNDDTVSSGNDIFIKLKEESSKNGTPLKTTDTPAETMDVLPNMGVKNIPESNNIASNSGTEQATAGVTQAHHENSTSRRLAKVAPGPVRNKGSVFTINPLEVRENRKETPENIQPAASEKVQNNVSNAQGQQPGSFIITQPMQFTRTPFETFVNTDRNNTPVAGEILEMDGRQKTNAINGQEQEKRNQQIIGNIVPIINPIGVVVNPDIDPLLAKKANGKNIVQETYGSSIIEQGLKRNSDQGVSLSRLETLNGKKGNDTYSVHLASYKSFESAKRGVQILASRLQGLVSQDDIEIVRVDLGPEKGIWFRVMYGDFADERDTDRIAQSFLDRTEYARSIEMTRENENPLEQGTDINVQEMLTTRRHNLFIVGKYAAMQKMENKKR